MLSLNWPADVDDETGILSYTFTPEEIREIVQQIKYKLESYEEVIAPITSSHYQTPFNDFIPTRITKFNDLEVTIKALQIDDNYIDLLGIELLEGRWFRRADDGAALKPVVIDQTMKEKFFPGESAIGKKIGRSVLLR